MLPLMVMEKNVPFTLHDVPRKKQDSKKGHSRDFCHQFCAAHFTEKLPQSIRQKVGWIGRNETFWQNY